MKLNNVFNQCNLYLTLWCLFLLLREYNSSRISALLLFGILFLSIFYWFYANLKYHFNIYLKSLNILLFLFTSYGLIRMFSGEVIINTLGQVTKPYGFLQNIYTSLLPIFAFYTFTRKGLLTQSVIKFWIIIFIPIAMFAFQQLNTRIIDLLSTPNVTITEFTNNYSYWFLFLLPGIALFKNRIFQFSALILCITYIIMGMKRGAILLLFLCIALFIYHTLIKSSSRKKMLTLVLSVVTIWVSYNIITWNLQNSDYFYSRLQRTLNGDSSERDIIYYNIFNSFISEDKFLPILLGHGAEATVRLTGNEAHNDWLEILYNHGMLGVLIYFYYWLAFLRTSIKSKKTCNELYLSFMLIIIILLGRSFFSMSYADLMIFTSIVLGYVLGEIDKAQYLLYENNS